VKKLTMTAGALAVLLVLGAPLGAAAQTAPPGEAEATAQSLARVACRSACRRQRSPSPGPVGRVRPATRADQLHWRSGGRDAFCAASRRVLSRLSPNAWVGAPTTTRPTSSGSVQGAADTCTTSTSMRALSPATTAPAVCSVLPYIDSYTTSALMPPTSWPPADLRDPVLVQSRKTVRPGPFGSV
jgi:hypothetical protein